MNKKIYKKVWNTSRGCLIVVNETKTSKGKAKAAALTVTAFILPFLLSGQAMGATMTMTSPENTYNTYYASYYNGGTTGTYDEATFQYLETFQAFPNGASLQDIIVQKFLNYQAGYETFQKLHVLYNSSDPNSPGQVVITNPTPDKYRVFYFGSDYIQYGTTEVTPFSLFRIDQSFSQRSQGLNAYVALAIKNWAASFAPNVTASIGGALNIEPDLTKWSAHDNCQFVVAGGLSSANTVSANLTVGALGVNIRNKGTLIVTQQGETKSVHGRLTVTGGLNLESGGTFYGLMRANNSLETGHTTLVDATIQGEATIKGNLQQSNIYLRDTDTVKFDFKNNVYLQPGGIMNFATNVVVGSATNNAPFRMEKHFLLKGGTFNWISGSTGRTLIINGTGASVSHEANSIDLNTSSGNIDIRAGGTFVEKAGNSAYIKASNWTQSGGETSIKSGTIYGLGGTLSGGVMTVGGSGHLELGTTSRNYTVSGGTINNGGTATITSPVFIGGTVNNNYGTMNISRLTEGNSVGGSIVSTGTLNLTTVSADQTSITASNGTVNLNNVNTWEGKFRDGAVTTNVNGAWKHNGSFTANNTFNINSGLSNVTGKLTNNGTLTINSGSTGLTAGTLSNAKSITNRKQLTVTGNSLVNNKNATINNTGTITASNATLKNYAVNDSFLNSGTINTKYVYNRGDIKNTGILTATSQLQLTGGGMLTTTNKVTLGSLIMNQAAAIENDRSLFAQLYVNGGSLTASGFNIQGTTRLDVARGATAELGNSSDTSSIFSGVLNNNGILKVTKGTVSGGSLSNTYNATFDSTTFSGGTVTNSSTATFTNPIVSSGSISNTGTLNVSGLYMDRSSGGEISSSNGTLNLTDSAPDGTNIAVSGGTLNINNVTTWNGKFTDNAAITNINGAWTHDGDFTANYTFNINAQKSTVNGSLTNQSALTIDSGSLGLTVKNLTNNSAIANNKLLTVSGNSFVNSANAAINNVGTITANSATIKNYAINGAFLNPGTISSANIENQGDISNTGTLSVTGSLKLTGGGMLTTSNNATLGSLVLSQDVGKQHSRSLYGQLYVTGGKLTAGGYDIQADTLIDVSGRAAVELGDASNTSSVFSGGRLTNNGTLKVTQGTLSGGTISNVNTAVLDNVTISSGEITNSSTLEINNPVTANGGNGSISSTAGLLKITNLNMEPGNNLSLSASGGKVEFRGTTNTRKFTSLDAGVEVYGDWNHATDYTSKNNFNVDAGQTVISGTFTNEGAVGVQDESVGLTANVVINSDGCLLENMSSLKATGSTGSESLSLENAGTLRNYDRVEVKEFLVNRASGVFSNIGVIENSGGITNYGIFNNSNNISLDSDINLRGGSFTSTVGDITVLEDVNFDSGSGAGNMTISGGSLTANRIMHRGSGTLELSGLSTKITTEDLQLQGTDGSIVISNGEFRVNNRWIAQNESSTSKIKISGGSFNIPYATGSSLFVGAGQINKSFSEIKSGTTIVEGSISKAWFTRVGAHLSNDIRLNQLEMSDTGNVTLRDATDLTARDVIELKQAWGERYGVDGTTALTIEGNGLEMPLDRDRLTVFVANAIGMERLKAIYFFRESLDGRVQQSDNTYRYSDDENNIYVSSSIFEDNHLASGFGFNSVQYANTLHVNDGSKISLTGVDVESKDTYLVSKNEGTTASDVFVGGTLEVGIDTVDSDLAIGKGRFGTVTIEKSGGNSKPTVKVRNGQYKFDTLNNTSESGILSVKSSKDTSLTIGAIREDIGTTELGGAGSLILDSDPSESYVLNNLKATGGNLAVTGGDYTVTTLNTLGKLNVTVDSSQLSRKATLKIDNSSAPLGGKLNADFAVGDYSTLAFTVAQDYDVNKIDLGENGNDRNLTNSGNLHTGELIADGVVYTQNGDSNATLISDAGWFTNSTLNLNAGFIDAVNIKDSEGNANPSLGQNTYVVRGDKTFGNLTHKQPDIAAWDPDWNNGFTTLKADTVTSITDITLKNGGILKVNHLDLTDTETPTIHMQGGVLETTLDNFFSGYTYQPVIPLEDQDVSGVEFGMNGVKDPIVRNLTNIDGNEGWIVITNDDIFVTAASQIISEMHNPSLTVNEDGVVTRLNGIGSGVGVEFSGHLVGEFTVDDANRFVEDDSIPEHAVVFRQVALANKVSTDREGINKHLWIGSKDGTVSDFQGSVPNRLNVGVGLGFTHVTNASSVTIENGKEFAMIGFENDVPFEEIDHADDPVRFNAATALLPDATGNGVVRVMGEGSKLTLGNKNITDYHSIGWLDSVWLEDKGKLFAQNGEYAIWHIRNKGGEFKVASNAYIHSKGTTDDSNGLWTNEGSIVFGEPDVDNVKVNLSGTLDNYGLVDANNTEKLTFNGTVNNYAGAEIAFNNGIATGVINNNAAEINEDGEVVKAAAKFIQTEAEGANYQLKSATFNNSGEASFTSLYVGTDTADKDATLSVFDNKASGNFSASKLVEVGGKGKFTQGGQDIDSTASLVVDAGGLYENNTQKVSRYESVRLGERASTDDPKATVNNYGEFEVKTGDFVNSGEFSNESHKGEAGNVSRFKVTQGDFKLIGGEFLNHQGASMEVGAGIASLAAGENLPDQVSKIVNHGSALLNNVEASGGSIVENGHIELLPEGDSLASFTAADLDFDSSFVKNYANLTVDNANFHNAADVEDDKQKKLFTNSGIGKVNGKLTLENAWAENRRGNNVANATLTTGSLDLLGDFSKLENYDVAEVGSVIFTGNAEIINGDKDHRNASFNAEFIVNKQNGLGDDAVEPANLTLHNEGNLKVADEIKVLGGLDLENGLAERLPEAALAKFEAASLIFKKEGENESHLTNEGTMNFIGKDGKGVELEGITVTNAQNEARASFKGPYLNLKDSSFDNYNLADFRNVDADSTVDPQGVTLIGSTFTNNAADKDSFAKLYGKSLSLTEGSQLVNEGLADFRDGLNYADYEDAASVVIDNSSVQTGVKDNEVSDWAEFYGSSLTIRNQAPNTVAFENQAKAEFSGAVSADSSSIITGTLNPEGDKKATFTGASLDLTGNNSRFINGSDAIFGKTTEGEEGAPMLVGGDITASGSALITNGITFEESEDGEIINKQTLNPNALIKGNKLTLSEGTDFINVGDAQFLGDVSATDNSSISSVILGDTAEAQPSISGLGLTLDQASSLANNGSAVFDGNVLIENNSYAESLSVDGAANPASVSGHDLTIGENSYLKNTGSAIFAANAASGATGAVSVAAGSHITNETEANLPKASLSAGKLDLADNSYLQNTSAQADFAGNISAANSYIESITAAALGQASLTGNDLTLKTDSHLTNQGGSAIFAANAATGATGAVDVSANSYIKNITADAANKATLSAGKLDLAGTSYLENTSAQADFAGDISAQASYITNTTQEGLGKASLTGGALTLQDSSYLENTSASADFAGDISAQASYITNTTQDGLGKAVLTGGALTLQDNSYLDNTSASADFAGNITAQTSYITNTTQSGLDKATLTGNDLTLTDSHLDNTSGSVTLTANATNASTGSISATNSYVTNKTVSGLDRATLDAADLSLLDGSYLANTDGSALFTGSITAKNGSYIESLTVDSEELAQLTGTSLELTDGHLINTGSALIGVNETTTADDGSETTVFRGGAINASNADILNGAVKDFDGNIVKANHEGMVLQAGDVTLDTGSFGNYASVVIGNADITDADVHNDANSSIQFTNHFVVQTDKDVSNLGDITGNGLFKVLGNESSENRTKLVNDGSLSENGASIKVGQFVAGADTIVDNSRTEIVADEFTEIGGDFALKNESSLDTGKLTVALNDSSDGNYLMDLVNSKVFAGSAEINSDLSIDESSELTVGMRKNGDLDLGTEENPNSAVLTGTITNKGQITSLVNTTQAGQVNDSGNLVGEVNLGDGVTYTAESGLYAADVSGKNVVFNQTKDGHVTVGNDGQWIHNSEVNIAAGKMDAVELGKDGLGNNIYRVAFDANPRPDRPQADDGNRITGENRAGQTVSWYELPQSWKDSQIVLKANSIARENGIDYGDDERKGAVVEVYEGGVFAVNSIVLDANDTDYTEAFIKLKGGALETTLDQLFAGEHHQAATGLDEENPGNPSSIVDYYQSLKKGVLSSISTDTGETDPTSYFVFTDDNVLASTAASVVTILHDANYKANVAFTGKSFENFDVDMANKLQSSVSSDPENPLNYRVVFTDTTLYNTTEAEGDTNRSLIIGQLEPPTEAEEGSNVIRTKELGLGFKAVKNADDLTIQEGNEFVLVGFNGKETVEGYEFGKSHEPDGPLDSELFSDKTKLLVDAVDSDGNSIGGNIVVKDGGTLSLGTQFNIAGDSRTIGWVDAVDLQNGSNVVVRGGEFALWQLSSGNEGSKVVVTDTGILHTDWITGNADVVNGNILYIEKSTGTVFNGSVANNGLFDTRGETVLENGERVMRDNTFTLSGVLDLTDEASGEITPVYNLLNEEGSKSIHDELILADGSKVKNDGSFDGNSLVVNLGSSVLNNGTSAWKATTVDGSYTNKGTLALGDGAHSVSSEGLLDNYKDLTAQGTITLSGTFNNHAGANAISTDSLNVIENGLVNNNSAMVFDAVKLAGLAGEDGLGTRFLNNNAVGEDGSVLSAATLDARSLEVLGTFDNDGRVTIKDKVIAAPEGSDEGPTIVSGNFALNGGSINNRGVFDVSGVADNKIEIGIFDNTGRLIASDMVQEDGTVTNSGSGTVRADSWTMNEGSFTNDASNYTKGEDGSLENVDVAIKGDFTQNGGTASNAGAMIAKNVSLLDKAVSFVNEGVRSLLGISENVTQESGAVTNDGTIVAGGFNEDGTPALDENGKPKSGNWTISDKASGLTNTSADSSVTLSGDITQSSGKVTNNGAISAGNWTVTANASTEEGAVPTEGIANVGAASNIALRGNLAQGAGSFLNEGTVTVGGNWSITDETTAVTNTVAAEQKALEKPFQPTITVGGDITQTAAKATNEGSITAGSWTIGGNSAGLDNVIAEGLTAENGKPTVTLSGNLTGSSGFITNDGTITAGLFNEDGSPLLDENGKPKAGNWTMSDKAASLTNTLTDSSVTLSGDITQSSGKVTNNGSISAGNWTVTANASSEEGAVPTEGIANQGAASNITLRGDLSQGAGSFLNEGTVKVGGDWSITDETTQVDNTVAADQKGLDKPFQPTITVGGDITQTAPAKTTNEGSITAGNWTISGTSAGLDNVIAEGLTAENGKPTVTLSGNLTGSSGFITNDGSITAGQFNEDGSPVLNEDGKPVAGNWTISDKAAGLTNTSTGSSVVLSGDIDQSSGMVINNGSISAGNWTVSQNQTTTDEEGNTTIANPTQGIANVGQASQIDLRGNLSQAAGNFANEGTVNIAGDWTESGSVRTIDNLKDTTVENPAIPTVTVGGDILQQHGFVTNEGKISAGYGKSGNAVEGKGNWTIDGITRGFANKGAESEIKLAGDLTQLFGHGQNDGTITADDYTIGSLGEDAGEFAGAGAAGLTNLGTVELRGSITESSGNVVNEGKIQAGFDSNGNAVEGKGDWTVSDMSGGFENKGASSQIILSGNLTQASGFASNEGEISVGFDKDGNALEGKGNWTINDKSTGFANQGAASSIKLAGDFTQSVGDGLNEGEFTAHNYTMDGIASGLNNKATTNGDGTVNTPSVTLTGSITQSSGMVNNEGTITAGYGAEADKGDWSFSGTAEGLANIGADTTVTLAGNISQASGFVSNDGRMTVGFDKEGTAIAGKGNWDINAPSATGFSNNLETSEIKLAGSISQEVGEATNKGLITAHDWTVTGSADGINNLGEKSRVELTGNLAQLHGDIVNEGSMIGVGSDGQPGADNTYTAAGSNTNTGVFIFKGDMTQTDGDITNSRVGGALPNGGDNFGTFMVGSITKSGGSIENSALFIANGDVTQTAGSITNKDGGFMNLNGDLTASEGPVSNLGVGSVINTGKAVFESAGAAIATPVTNEGTINLESAKFALGSSLDNTGTINFRDFVSFDNMDEYRNDGKILETVDPDRVERTKVSIGDSIIFATSGEIKADVLEIGSDTPYSAEDNSRNTFKTADFGKDNTQLHVGNDAAFTLNGEEPTDVFKLGSTTVASNAGTITLNNVTATNDGYLNNAGGTILINQGTNFDNNGMTVPATEEAAAKLGGIKGGSVIIDAGAHLKNSGTLEVANLKQSANSVGSIYIAQEDGSVKLTDEEDKDRAHFHQIGGTLNVSNDWFDNTNIYVENGAKIVVQDPNGTIRSLGNNNLYVLRSGEDIPEINWVYDENGELNDLRLKDENTYLNTNKYVRFSVDNVTLDGNNVFKVESGGTLDVNGLDRTVEKLNPTIVMDGGGVQVSLGQVFNTYPLGVGEVRDQVQNTVNLADGNGFLIFDDLFYSVDDVVTARRNIDKLSDTSKDNISIAFLGFLINKELLVSQAHDLTTSLDDEDRRSVFDLSRNTLGNDRFPDGYGENNHTIRVGTIQGEDDNYTIQESILVKNVGEAETVKPSYIVDSISIEDGRSFGLGGWLASENDGSSYNDDANRLFKETDGSVHVVDGKFGLGGLEKSVKEVHEEATKGWLGEVTLEDKGRMEVWDGEFGINNVTNKGLIEVKDGSTLHAGNYNDALGDLGRDGLENGSKGLINRGSVYFEEDGDTLTIDSALHNYGKVKLADNVNTLEVTGLVNDRGSFISDGDHDGANANLKNLVIKDGATVNNLLLHSQDSLTVEGGAAYNVGSVQYVEHFKEDGSLDYIEKQVNPALAKWTQTQLDGSLRVAEGSKFEARSDESGALETTFGGTGYIVNAGTVDLTNAAKATISHIYNEDDAPEIENATRAAGIVRFNELTITAASDELAEGVVRPEVENKVSYNPEKGTVSGNTLNLADSHRFINLGAVDLKDQLNLQGSNRWDNAGTLGVANVINLGSGHQFNNSGSVTARTINQGIFSDDAADKTGGTLRNDLGKTITLSHFNQGQGSKLENNGTIRFVNEELASDVDRAPSSLVLRGLVQNSGTIDASVVEESHIIGAGNPYVEGNVKAENATYVNQAGAHGTFQDVVVSDGARVENYGTHEFNDLFVNSGSEYTNYAKDSGRYLTVNKDSKYTVESTGESLWTDVFVIEGELEVIKGGTLTVLRDQGSAARAFSNETVPENAEVHGKLTNHGVSRFHNLTLKESSQSLNNGDIIGGHLLQEKSAGIHTTSEISNSTWEVVEINEGLDNAGTFTINEALVANAKIHNSGTFSVGEKVVEQVLTHEFDNEGAATFNNLTLQAPEESVLLAEAPRTDLDLGQEEGSEGSDVGSGETPTIPDDVENPGEAPSAGGSSEAVRFINHGEAKEVHTLGRFEINAGFDVIVEDGATNTHKDLVLQGGTLSVLNGGHLEVQNKANLKGGEFLIGNMSLARDAESGETYNTSVDLPLEGPINSAVSVISGGELRIGSGALDEAVRAGAELRQGSPRLILSQPIEIGSAGSIAVGASSVAAPGGASFGSDSQLIVNFAQLSEAPAITGAGGSLSVEKGAEVQVNVTGIHKGRYYITQDFENTNAVGNQWEGGWKDNLVLIPRDMVARWKVSFGNDGTNTWIDANQTEKPDVAAPDVAGELLDKEPPGPGAQIVQNLLNGENGIDPETAKKAYNSLVNIGFAGAQMATAYSTLTNAADAVQNRGSMIAEGFNRDGWRAHKTRTGDAWIQVLGSRDRVERYDASKIKGGYESKSTGFIGGIARNLESANATVGAAISYQRGQAKSKEGVMHTENRFYTFGAEVYGNWSPNPLINIIGDAGYYYNEGKIDQRLVPESGFRKANTRVHTNMYTIGARAESTLKVGQASVIPHVGVRWIHGKSSKYDTKLDGQTAFNSTPKATDTWQFPFGISVRGDITTKSGWKIRPTADVSVVLQAGDRTQSILFGSPEASATNMIYGRFTGNQIYTGQLGVQIEKGAVTYGIRYGYSTGGYGKSDHEIKVEAIWRF